MRHVAITLLLGALTHVASGQTCNSASTCSSCAFWSSSSSYRMWCSDDGYSSSGCCIVTSYRSDCPSNYQYQSSLSSGSSFGCSSSYINPQYTRANLNAAQIVYIVIVVAAYFINIGAVVSFCKRRNIPPCGYIAIAIFVHVWVWCCLIPAGRQSQQLVFIQTAPQHSAQPYVMPGQPYVPQPYGQPGYGQSAPYPQAQPGYAPQEPPNPYNQPPNPYNQQQNQQQNPYANNPYAPPPQNYYAQAPNPYASGEIVKPQ